MEKQDQRPILIQGAHEPELALIRDNLTDLTQVTDSSFKFWVGNLRSPGSSHDVVLTPVVVSETGIGSALAAASVTVAYRRFDPIAIINQGMMPDSLSDRIYRKYMFNIGGGSFISSSVFGVCHSSSIL
jgi:hypothetical protein